MSNSDCSIQQRGCFELQRSLRRLQTVREGFFHFAYLVHCRDIGLVTQYCSELLRERLNLLRRTLVILATSTGRATIDLDFQSLFFVPGFQNSPPFRRSVTFTPRGFYSAFIGRMSYGSIVKKLKIKWGAPAVDTKNPGVAFSVPMIATTVHEFICDGLPSHDGQLPGFGVAQCFRDGNDLSKVLVGTFRCLVLIDSFSSIVFHHKTLASRRGRWVLARRGALGPSGLLRLKRVYFFPLDCPLRR